MAEKSGCPMILVAMTGTDDIFENNKPAALRRAKVKVIFDKAVYPSDLEGKERKEFYASIPDRLQDMMDNNK